MNEDVTIDRSIPALGKSTDLHGRRQLETVQEIEQLWEGLQTICIGVEQDCLFEGRLGDMADLVDIVLLHRGNLHDVEDAGLDRLIGDDRERYVRPNRLDRSGGNNRLAPK